MKIKAWQIIIVAALIGLAWAGWKFGYHPSSNGAAKTIHARIGNIQTSISTTGTVSPKNRLQVTPPVNGRIEKILVQEGQNVKAGDPVAVMSSTDRAALLDAARGQGEEKLKYWEDVYKPITLIAPINGEVIVGTIQPGQAVTTADPVIVLSDRLIVRAQVDETDIGKIKVGQKAAINIDAYPDARINAAVDHIYYESKTVNNVTIYEVDLLPDTVPDFFRSGMNTNVDFVQDSKQNVLVLPLGAIQREQGETFVMVQPEGSGKPIKRSVVLGVSDDKKIEIVSGLSEDDAVVIKTKKLNLPQNSGTNPFAPPRRTGGGGGGGR